jgi:hypothetical protein
MCRSPQLERVLCISAKSERAVRVFEYCVTAAPDVTEQVAIALLCCSPVFPLRTSQALLHGARGFCGLWIVVCWLAWVPSGGGSQGDDSGHPEAAVSVLHHPGGL